MVLRKTPGLRPLHAKKGQVPYEKRGSIERPLNPPLVCILLLIKHKYHNYISPTSLPSHMYMMMY